MPSKEKVWVIDSEPTVHKNRAASFDLRAHAARPSSSPGPAPSVDAPQQLSTTAQASGAATTQQIVAAYLLGSAAPSVVQHSRQGGIWAVLGIGAFSIWSLVVAQWNLVQASLGSGLLPFHVWFVGMSVASLVGIAAWSRGILVAGLQFSRSAPRSNRWLRGSLKVGVLGVLVPGLGLLLARRPRRAAIAYCSFGMFVQSVVVLWCGRLLWEAHQHAASPGFDSTVLERILVASIIATLLGGLAWIIGAYEGARLANRIPLGASMQGPWWVVAVILSVLAFFSTFDPGQRARDLDGLSTSLRATGFRYIPLQLQLASLRFDPSNLAYRIQVAELYEELGRVAESAAMRDDILRRWEAYALRIEGAPPAELAASDAPLLDAAFGDRQIDFLLPIEP